MNVLVWISFLALVLTCIWNLGVPMELIRRSRRNPEATSQGISLLLALQALLLVMSVGCSFLSTGEQWVNQPLLVGFIGLSAIVASFLGMFLIGTVGGWLHFRSAVAGEQPEQREG